MVLRVWVLRVQGFRVLRVWGFRFLGLNFRVCGNGI